jgi:predicted ester cyclase
MSLSSEHAAESSGPLASAPRELVRQFLTVVRSGKAPERAAEFLAPRVVAHQLVSEGPEDVLRTPDDYAAHVRDFLATWGPFELEVTELLADGDRVYARWIQRGRHLAAVDGHSPTGLPVIELASAVYRVAGGRIVEYWIQIDRTGTEAQLRRNSRR